MEVDESPSSSGTSTPALQDTVAKSASGNRFEALLQHTELLSHFGKKKDSPQKVMATLGPLSLDGFKTFLVNVFANCKLYPNKGTLLTSSLFQAKVGRKKKPTAPQGTEGDSRHRKTEQEEDEELLSDLNQAKSQSITFDESPPFIKVCGVA